MRIRDLFIAAIATCGLSSFALAQQPTSQLKPPSGKERRSRSMEERMDRFAEELKLSTAQKSNVRKVIEDSNKKIESWGKDTKLSPVKRSQMIEAERKAVDGRIRALLSTEQKKKFDQMQKEAAQKRARLNQPPKKP